MAPVRVALLDLVDSQRGALMPWSPVAFGGGIGLYFAAAREPPVAALAAGLIGALALCLLLARLCPRALPLGVGLALMAAGAGDAALRARLVAAPVLARHYHGPIEGRVVDIDRSLSDRPRLTLDRVWLAGLARSERPGRVRLALHGAAAEGPLPEPGSRIGTTGHLSPPGGAVEPGGFDFRRNAWFQGIGGMGYTRAPVVVISPSDHGARGLVWLARMRHRLGEAVRQGMPGEEGAFAAAIIAGDRSGIGRATLDALRDSNLAHLLAISGLHMGLLAGVVFGALRLLLAAVPALALVWPVKKIAALGALAAAAVYYALSGGNVATERAFVMVAVVLVAVLLDRRALTLRAVAVAALIVLALRPESLLSPGFQMSFAATAALVGVFAALRDRPALAPPRWARAPLAMAVSSAVAGFATAPVAAAHFNRIADFGLAANLASVPLMGLAVMPGAVLAASLAPFGLAGVGLAVMRPAIAWILAVAHRVAEWPGAVTPVPAPPGWVLPTLALGGLVVLLWQGRGRWLGVPLAAVALAGWAAGGRPALLVSEDGALMGLMTPAGRALSKPRGQGFAARLWLENDGDAASQAEAAARGGLTREAGLVRARLDRWVVIQLSGRGAAARLGEACAGADLVILAARARDVPEGCRVLDAVALRRLGALAVEAGADGLRVQGARARAGDRLWTPERSAPPREARAR